MTRFGGYCMIDSEPGAGAVIRLFLPRHKNPASSDTGSPAVGAGNEASRSVSALL